MTGSRDEDAERTALARDLIDAVAVLMGSVPGCAESVRRRIGG